MRTSIYFQPTTNLTANRPIDPAGDELAYLVQSALLRNFAGVPNVGTPVEYNSPLGRGVATSRPGK